ncbi:MAG: glycosidase [Spirochaetes bacterium]|nr:glycosidase [Spirochaetota bacterium]
MTAAFQRRLHQLREHEQELLKLKNRPLKPGSGVFFRYQNPVLTANHIPLHWRYDLNPDTNPYLMERLGVNAVLNPGAIILDDKINLIVRVEGVDRKSFFAVAESENGIDSFRFHDYPVDIASFDIDETNIYDMRLTQHEDGWIYGLFCTEKRDSAANPSDQVSAIAQCGILRTRDLRKWERLPDLITPSQQQRNVVLHPEFVNGRYGLYTRPQDSFISTGRGGGIGWALTDSMEKAEVKQEKIMDSRTYHTISELKNGQGPPPLKTPAGWLHLAHGVRNTAAGLRYVLYLFLTSLDQPDKIIKKPGGYFLAPEGEERVGDVSNVVFCNGWVVRENQDVFIYYASSDTRIHVATSTIEQLLDYVNHSPPDPLTFSGCVKQRNALIKNNQPFLI